MNMTLRLLLLLCYLSFPIIASAQASGGQIRRNTQKTKIETRKSTESCSNKTSIQSELHARSSVTVRDGQESYSLSTSKECYELAKKLRMEGDGKQAIDLFKKAYEMGDSPYRTWALHQLGCIYYLGLGGIKYNYYDAYMYFRMASDIGCLPSMYYLALCYEYGRGVSKDLSRA